MNPVRLGRMQRHFFHVVGVETEHLLVERHPRRQIGTVASRDLTVDRAKLLSQHCNVIVDVEVMWLREISLSNLH